MKKRWTGEELLEMARGYRASCVLVAAAETGLFDLLAKGSLSAAGIASALSGETRAVTILADALVALGLLAKKDDRYAAAAGVAEALAENAPEGVLPMLLHQANCLRGWSRLAETVRGGGPVDRRPSIRGERADHAAFIEAMEVVSREAAPRLVASLRPLAFRRLLDIGGGPGTWTIAFLRALPEARAILFDLPDVLPIARRHVERAGLAGRVDFVGGDYTSGASLPGGADFAWVSAIVHQNGRDENRRLFAKVHTALAPGGEIAIRDMVMDDARTSPPAGALFAVNMLVHTEGGGTFTLAELAADLRSAGFGEAVHLPGEREMDSVVRAPRL